MFVTRGPKECATPVASEHEMETKKDSPDRSKINMNDPFEVKHWIKHLNVSKDDLQRAVDKVGNSAAAVKKELGQRGQSSA